MRELFEQRIFVYYQRLKRAGWSDPEEGGLTFQSMFWRHDENPDMYGVKQVQAAWVGFQLAYGSAVVESDPLQ